METKNNDETLIGIYAVEPIDGTNGVYIKHTDTIKGDAPIRDTFIKQYELTKDVVAGICACNITHFFIEKSKKLPVMNVTVCLNKYLRTVPLYRLFLDFEITSNIDSVDDLLNKPVIGKYSLNVAIGMNGITLSTVRLRFVVANLPRT